MRVTDLHIYPVKSTAPTDLDRARVERGGLAGDRRWLVVDAAGEQLTAREHRRLLHARATIIGPGALRLSGPHAEDLIVDGNALTDERKATVWSTPFAVLDAGDTAADWFGELLDTPARLVYQADPAARPITGSQGREGETVSAADGYPLLLASTSSLARLNNWIAEDRPDQSFDPLPMRRFRPNVVIDSDLPFAEDAWLKVRIGSVTFRSAGACSRCVLTTIDPATLVSGKEPIRTLARHHSWSGKTYFGLNLIPTATGDIAIGDEVEVVALSG